ncbi:MAG: hypothetical protein OEY05_06895 [Paracoccaceae bacterium]|nr:hypothetical protein [Paracoccaceae bacterium]
MSRFSPFPFLHSKVVLAYAAGVFVATVSGAISTERVHDTMTDTLEANRFASIVQVYRTSLENVQYKTETLGRTTKKRIVEAYDSLEPVADLQLAEDTSQTASTAASTQ